MPDKLRLNTRGDTIVEVMIVLAILGLAIGIAYATANRSLVNARQAQEHAAATHIAQSQVEGLRSLVASTTQDIFQPGPYCVSPPTGTPDDPYHVIPGTCAIVYPGGGISYQVAITYTNTASAPDTFTVAITWPSVIGEGNDSVTQTYRIHRP